MIEQLGKKIPRELFKNTQCNKKYFILAFYHAWFWGRCGKEFCWAGGELWE